jgi:hypothetical protein
MEANRSTLTARASHGPVNETACGRSSKSEPDYLTWRHGDGGHDSCEGSHDHGLEARNPLSAARGDGGGTQVRGKVDLITPDRVDRAHHTRGKQEGDHPKSLGG